MFGYRENDSDRDSRHGGGGGGGGNPLHTEKIVTERKIFFLDLKENDRGRFVKITEDVRGRRDTIMLPLDNLEEFIDALSAIRAADLASG